MPLFKARSPSTDKGVTSQQEHTECLTVITMHSHQETARIRHVSDKLSDTQLSLDKIAQNWSLSAEVEEDKAPPPLFKRSKGLQRIRKRQHHS
jgi:hypothetical protein